MTARDWTIEGSEGAFGEALGRAFTLGARVRRDASTVDYTGKKLAAMYADTWRVLHEKALRTAFVAGKRHADAAIREKTSG